MDFKDFLLWEQTTRDTIDLKKIYVDVAGDLISGVLLSQIVYWNLPNQKGESKLRVMIDNELWLAKGRDDWWDECRITSRQFDRSIKILENKKIITSKIKKFNGNPTKHLKLNLKILIENINNILNPCDSLVFTQNVKTNLTKVEKRNLQKCKNEINKNVKTLTENTTQIKKTENTKSSSSTQTSWEKLTFVYEEAFKPLSSYIKNKINTYIEKTNIDFVIAILEYCIEHNAKSPSYFFKTLDNLIEKNITTVQALEVSVAKFNKEIENKKKCTKKSSSSNNQKTLNFTNYSQRDYDYPTLENQLLESNGATNRVVNTNPLKKYLQEQEKTEI